MRGSGRRGGGRERCLYERERYVSLGFLIVGGLYSESETLITRNSYVYIIIGAYFLY